MEQVQNGVYFSAMHFFFFRKISLKFKMGGLYGIGVDRLSVARKSYSSTRRKVCRWRSWDKLEIPVPMQDVNLLVDLMGTYPPGMHCQPTHPIISMFLHPFRRLPVLAFLTFLSTAFMLIQTTSSIRSPAVVARMRKSYKMKLTARPYLRFDARPLH